jgi:PIN domain nuclease of toxin-antitoxin system
MSLLLDTCAFIWWMADDPALARTPAEAIKNPQQTCCLSTVSIWEMLVKQAIGKLEIDSGTLTTYDYLVGLCRDNRIDMLPLTANEVRHVSTLPDIHRDPFDRLLICQAVEHGYTLVTPDPHIRRYPVKTLW